MYLYKYKNKQHENLFIKYFNHYDTPRNNSSYENLKIFPMNLDNLFMYIVDNEEIVATFGAIETKLDNYFSAIKMPHRLHIRKDYSRYHNRFIDQYFEPTLYEWFDCNNVRNLVQTINKNNLRAALLSWKRHNRRKKYGTKYVNLLGKKFIECNWTILPFMIFEQNTWQYACWASLDNVVWKKSWRRCKDIDLDVVENFNKNFTKTENGWLI